MSEEGLTIPVTYDDLEGAAQAAEKFAGALSHVDQAADGATSATAALDRATSGVSASGGSAAAAVQQTTQAVSGMRRPAQQTAQAVGGLGQRVADGTNQLGQMAGALGNAAAVVGQASPQFQQLSGVVGSAGTAMSALSTSMGPVGVAIAAITVAVPALTLAYEHLNRRTTEMTQANLNFGRSLQQITSDIEDQAAEDARLRRVFSGRGTATEMRAERIRIEEQISVARREMARAEQLLQNIPATRIAEREARQLRAIYQQNREAVEQFEQARVQLAIASGHQIERQRNAELDQATRDYEQWLEQDAARRNAAAAEARQRTLEEKAREADRFAAALQHIEEEALARTQTADVERAIHEERMRLLAEEAEATQAISDLGREIFEEDHQRQLELSRQLFQARSDALAKEQEERQAAEEAARAEREKTIEATGEYGQLVGGIIAETFKAAVDGEKDAQQAAAETTKRALEGLGTQLIVKGAGHLAEAIALSFSAPADAAAKASGGALELAIGLAVGGIGAGIPIPGAGGAGASRPDVVRSEGGGDGGNTTILFGGPVITAATNQEVGRTVGHALGARDRNVNIRRRVRRAA